jgi:hypothetical protein
MNRWTNIPRAWLGSISNSKKKGARPVAAPLII